MATQIKQVFIRSTDVGAPTPMVIAMYPEANSVPNDTHGEGMSVYILPVEAIAQPVADPNKFRMPCLVENWQNYVGTVSVGAEATRRIQETFTTSEQIDSLRQTVASMQKYGTDVTKWPLEARKVQAASDEKWRYVDEVKAQAKTHSTATPFDLSSDKAWPNRPVKK